MINGRLDRQAPRRVRVGAVVHAMVLYHRAGQAVKEHAGDPDERARQAVAFLRRRDLLPPPS